MIQADGGTRTASITGAWVALHDCLDLDAHARDDRGQAAARPCRRGLLRRLQSVAVLDLDYAEDSEAETDANFVMTGAGNIVEVQATAEKTPFSEEQLLALLALARSGIGQAGRSAEDGGDVNVRTAHRPIAGRLVIATHNPGKLAEMRDLLAPYGIEAVSAGELGLPEPEETGTTFHANARIKAHGRGEGVGHAGVRRQFRAGGRCARRRARHPLGALGRAGQGLSPRHERVAGPS